MKFSPEYLKLLVIALAEYRGTFNNGAKLMVKVWGDGGDACSHTSHHVHKFYGGGEILGGGGGGAK